MVVKSKVCYRCMRRQATHCMLCAAFALPLHCLICESHLAGPREHASSVPQTAPPPPPEPPKPTPSILDFLTQWAGSGRSTLVNPLATLTPKISTCNPRRFAKYAKNQHVYAINFHPAGSPAYIASISSSPLSDDISDPPAELPPPDSTFLPDKYLPWAHTVFSPIAVDNLPPHRPYDCHRPRGRDVAAFWPSLLSFPG